MNGTGPTDTTTWLAGSTPSSSPIIFIPPTGFGIRVRAHRRFDPEHPFRVPPSSRVDPRLPLFSPVVPLPYPWRSLRAPRPPSVVSPIAPHPPVSLATANPLVSPATLRQPVSLLFSHPPWTPWRRCQPATPLRSGRCKLMTSLSRALPCACALAAGGGAVVAAGGIAAQAWWYRYGARVRMRLRFRGPVGEIRWRDSRVEIVFRPAFAQHCSYRNEQARGLSRPTSNSNTSHFFWFPKATSSGTQP